MSDESHYDVLGVAPGANKGAVRDAYRTKLDASAGDDDAAAKVRRAWQVLSDPVQRDRYDAEIGLGRAAGRPAPTTSDAIETVGADEVEVVDDDEVEVVTRDWRGRPRGGNQRPGAANRPPIQRPPSLLSGDPLPIPDGWPRGFKPPPPKARTMALAVDALVLLIFFVLSQVVGAVAIDKMYPVQTDRIDVLDKQVKHYDKVDTSLHKTLDTATKNHNKAKVKDVNAAIKKNTKKNDKVKNERKDLIAKTQPGQLAVTLVLFAVMMLYLGLPSRKTGQTFGKRLFQIRVIRLDGAAIGWREITRRYGIPLLVALTLMPFLGPVSFAVLAFVVVRWRSNANYQGMHDRFAGTRVVRVS